MISKSFLQSRAFATKMMAGSTSNKKDSAGRRLGIKRFGQAEVLENEIVARQRGLQWHPGNNMSAGKDHTLHATIEGVLGWSKDQYSRKRRTYIHVIPQEIPNRKLPPPPPFMYHPELFPELALNNPPPSNFEIPKAKGPKRVRTPSPLKAQLVEKPQRIDLKLSGMRPELFKFHGAAIY